VKENVNAVYLKDGRKVENRQRLREVWISPFLPSGAPNPYYKPEDAYSPRGHIVEYSEFFVDGIRVSEKAASRLIGAEASQNTPAKGGEG
jgi:hypothetical protein